jgi:hypothetical protein
LQDTDLAMAQASVPFPPMPRRWRWAGPSAASNEVQKLRFLMIANREEKRNRDKAHRTSEIVVLTILIKIETLGGYTASRCGILPCRTWVTTAANFSAQSSEPLSKKTAFRRLTLPVTLKAAMIPEGFAFRSDSSLSPAQMRAIASLAEGFSVVAASRYADVSRATIYSWLKLPNFVAALVQARHDFANFMQEKFFRIASAAIDNIQHILTDDNTSPALRLRASLAIVDRPFFPKTWLKVDETQVTQFAVESSDMPEVSEASEAPASSGEIARNAPCPCGSGNKYKRCCGVTAPPVLFQTNRMASSQTDRAGG